MPKGQFVVYVLLTLLLTYAYSSCDNLTKHSILGVNNIMFVTVVGDMFHALL